VKKGDLILSTVFGAGFTWGSAIFRVPPPSPSALLACGDSGHGNGASGGAGGAATEAAPTAAVRAAAVRRAMAAASRGRQLERPAPAGAVTTASTISSSPMWRPRVHGRQLLRGGLRQSLSSGEVNFAGRHLDGTTTASTCRSRAARRGPSGSCSPLERASRRPRWPPSDGFVRARLVLVADRARLHRWPAAATMTCQSRGHPRERLHDRSLRDRRVPRGRADRRLPAHRAHSGFELDARRPRRFDGSLRSRRRACPRPAGRLLPGRRGSQQTTQTRPSSASGRRPSRRIGVDSEGAGELRSRPR
jgi:hypothetical protein